MLPLEEAQARLLALAPAMGSEEVAVEAAIGRRLAADVIAARTQPPANLSAMDGYAIAGDGPWTLIGESRAGAPFGSSLKGGEAVRISTGAHMPNGSDRVLIQENASLSDGVLSTDEPPEAMRHVRPRGFDFADGDTVLTKGTRFGPAQLALAIAAGHASLQVTRQPRVAVLDSGDELAADPTACGPDQIPASNGAMLAAMASPLVGMVKRIGPVADDMAALAEALAMAEDCDILITSGGASVGDHDLVKPALLAWGAEIDFWKVAIKPGKPLMVARRGSQVILGLPGNPVSSFVTAFLFALPLIRASMGDPNPLPRALMVKVGEDLPEVGSRREFLRGVSDGQTVRLAASQDSSALLALAQANCLIDRPSGAAPVSAGEPAAVYNLQNG
jgi:molybdopterin molybdotransferase